MFNLGQAILDRRRQMAASGIKAPDVLDELESHLRDDLEEQMKPVFLDSRTHDRSGSRGLTGLQWMGASRKADLCA